MANMLYKTKYDGKPAGKPRVYFTCHPDDFGKYFNKICDDILDTHSCAIYYTENLSEPIDELETSIGSCNLFVIAITQKLLESDCRAMAVDLPYALDAGMHVLPIAVETGIDAFYSLYFGEIQYLQANANDGTVIPYREKLKKYLDSVLVSDETAKRVKNAFDAYIFLSYRKKDRAYANELMRLIHKHPDFRDIAIWYDEFLTPGESFVENIEHILSDSKLFTLLVTPNLLEEPDGKPNFVMGREYPAAMALGLPVLPAEMEETDKAVLKEKFESIPDCANPRIDEDFKARLLSSLSKIAVSSNNSEPEHMMLIGLAYFEGIDVEVDRVRGAGLIEAAANANLHEAMEIIYKICLNGEYPSSGKYRKDREKENKEKAYYWSEKLAGYCISNFGLMNDKTLRAYSCWASQCYDRDKSRATTLYELIYKLSCRLHGQESEQAFEAARDLIRIYSQKYEKEKYYEAVERAYSLAVKLWGEDSEQAVSLLEHKAICYDDDHPEKFKLLIKLYNIRVKIHGETSYEVLLCVGWLWRYCFEKKQYRMALAYAQQEYSLAVEIYGQESAETIDALAGIRATYGTMGDTENEEKLSKKEYELNCKVFGKGSMNAIKYLESLAKKAFERGDLEQARKDYEKIYISLCEGGTFAEFWVYWDIVTLLDIYIKLDESLDIPGACDKLYAIFCEHFGNDALTQEAHLRILSKHLSKCRRRDDYVAVSRRMYDLCCEKYGEKSEKAIDALYVYATALSAVGEYETEKLLYKKAYSLALEVLGENNITTGLILENLAEVCKMTDDLENALLCYEQLYPINVSLFSDRVGSTYGLLKEMSELHRKLGHAEKAEKLMDEYFEYEEKYGGDI